MKVQGSRLPIELPQERNWSPNKGWTTSRKWVGESAAITSLAASIQAEQGAFVSMSVSPQDAGTAHLTVTLDDLQDGAEAAAQSNGEPEPDLDTWTLQGNDYEKDIWSHPSIRALATSAPDDYNWLRKNLPPIQKNGTWKDVIDAWYTTLGSTGAGTWNDAATTLSIFKMFRDGIESWSLSQFVLRRSRTIKSRSQGTLSVSNVGKQFTVAQLQAFEGLPLALKFATPTSGTWIKRTPSVSYDGNKITCEGEFWHADDWHYTLYPFV